MRRYFWRLDELRALLYRAYPQMAQVNWIDDALTELWQDAAPSPRSWHYRMITPSLWAQFAHDVGQRIGREVTERPSG
jgi:hypothetical protein